eukprot:m.324168 g.324168  ORF g.324168 m.324168 type:complete len:593 (-) comp16540_c10_seq22:153-1931(-)
MGKKKGNSLGKAMMRQRFKGRDPNDPNFLHTTDMNDGYDWAKMGSCTEQRDLDEFLSTAELAGTDFTAEKLNVMIVEGTHANGLMSDKEKTEMERAQRENKHLLRIPRRPAWTRDMTKEELIDKEKESFLEWRRTLATLQDVDKVVVTPFERNIEFWRQLWRVTERSDVLVQIVDARNPLLFWCQDLEAYVKELSADKSTLLLLNKADLVPSETRKQWAEYFDTLGVRYAFFSALESDEAAIAEQLRANLSITPADPPADLLPDDAPTSDEPPTLDDAPTADETPTTDNAPTVDEASTAETSESWQVHSCTSLLDLLHKYSLEVLQKMGVEDRQPTVGMVGYPNVGKSSTVNALCLVKKVPVSSTPGRTRHFQTILLGNMTLCDCPGLVFPNFANTKAEMVCNGILPIDQLTDCIPPMTYVCRTIPRKEIERVYGIDIIKPAQGDPHPNRAPTAYELIDAFGTARGMMNGRGMADGPRCARIILKDFVAGAKLCYCASPPDVDVEGPAPLVEQDTAREQDFIIGTHAHNREYLNPVDTSFFSQVNVRALTKDKSALLGKTKSEKGGKKHYKGGKREKLRRREGGIPQGQLIL